MRGGCRWRFDCKFLGVEPMDSWGINPARGQGGPPNCKHRALTTKSSCLLSFWRNKHFPLLNNFITVVVERVLANLEIVNNYLKYVLEGGNLPLQNLPTSIHFLTLFFLKTISHRFWITAQHNIMEIRAIIEHLYCTTHLHVGLEILFIGLKHTDWCSPCCLFTFLQYTSARGYKVFEINKK